MLQIVERLKNLSRFGAALGSESTDRLHMTMDKVGGAAVEKGVGTRQGKAGSDLGVRRAKGESFLGPADASFFFLFRLKQASSRSLSKVRSSSVSCLVGD